LFAEGVGDFLLEIEGAFQKSREGVLFGAKTTTHAKERLERFECHRLLPPEAGVPGGVAGGFSDRGVDQHPLFAVGDQPDAALVGAAEKHHSFGRSGGPRLLRKRILQVGLGRIDGDQQPRSTAAAANGEVGGILNLVFLGAVDDASRESGLGGERFAVVFETIFQDHPHPGIVQGR
jgi:hypothetical protein